LPRSLQILGPAGSQDAVLGVRRANSPSNSVVPGLVRGERSRSPRAPQPPLGFVGAAEDSARDVARNGAVSPSLQAIASILPRRKSLSRLWVSARKANSARTEERPRK